MRVAQLRTAEGRPQALEAEEMLLMAVFQQAIADLDDSCPAVRADAFAYIYSYGSDYSIFSFDSVCAYFKLSPTAVRRALRQRTLRARPASPAYQTVAA